VHGRFQETGFALVKGQPNPESSAATDLALKLNPATVSADDTLDDHQA
jgi:hypothetical protein